VASCDGRRARSLRELRAPGPSTPDATAAAAAARGGGSYCVAAARRLVRARSESSTARARCRFESCREAHAPRQPRHWPSRYGRGAVTAPAPGFGMTRTDNKPLFRNRSAARIALLDERARGMRVALTPSEAALWAHPARAAARRGVSPASAAARSFHCGFLGTRRAAGDRGRWRASRRAGSRGCASGCGAGSRGLPRAAVGCGAGHARHRGGRLTSSCGARALRRVGTKQKVPGIRVAGDSHFFCGLFVGAGRLDGCHHRGRVLMRDRRENRGVRVRLPDGRTRWVT